MCPPRQSAAAAPGMDPVRDQARVMPAEQDRARTRQVTHTQNTRQYKSYVLWLVRVCLLVNTTHASTTSVRTCLLACACCAVESTQYTCLYRCLCLKIRCAYILYCTAYLDIARCLVQLRPQDACEGQAHLLLVLPDQKPEVLHSTGASGLHQARCRSSDFHVQSAHSCELYKPCAGLTSAAILRMHASVAARRVCLATGRSAPGWLALAQAQSSILA